MVKINNYHRYGTLTKRRATCTLCKIHFHTSLQFYLSLSRSLKDKNIKIFFPSALSISLYLHLLLSLLLDALAFAHD
jgi:hypothetical protein